MIAYFNKINAPDKSNFRYAFTDLNAKITHKFNDRNVLSANFYTGNDVFKFLNDSEIIYNYDPQGNKETRREISDISLAWGNTVGSLNWEYEINDKLSLSNKLYYSGSLSGSRYRDESYEDNVSEISGIDYSSDVHTIGLLITNLSFILLDFLPNVKEIRLEYFNNTY